MKDLSTYLCDHLAGSVGAIEMLEGMSAMHKDHAIVPFLERLRADIVSDQRELKQLMDRLGIEESAVRKAGAWIGEKVSRVKLRLGDTGEPSLELLQSLEALSLGITGKRSLWRTLAAAAETTPRLRGPDYARLEARAADQFERAEARSTAMGREIFPGELNSPNE